MDSPYTVESRADFDALVKGRLDRQARKYADYDPVKARAAELERATTAHETALAAEKTALAAAEARATTAEAWKANRESADALAQVRGRPRRGTRGRGE